MKTGKRHLFLGFTLALLMVTALAVFNLKQPTQTETRAAGSTTLKLVPASSTKQAGDTIDLDIMVDPGSNLISLIKFQLAFDSAKLALSTTDPFTLNTASFPVKVEGPIINSESIGVTVSIGADATKAIQKPTKVGTAHFKALSSTNGTQATVTFTNLTQALSIGSSDKSYQSVLSSTTPATITISGNSAITPKLTPSTSLTPPQTGSPTTVSFDLLLHGVGSAGDNPNPSGNSLSNKTPLHPQRDLQVEIYNSENKLITKSSGGINYDAGSGTFKGAIGMDSNVKEGSYVIKVRTGRYLRKRIPGFQTLIPLKDNRIPRTNLVAGDTNADNTLDILDYNAFLDCGYGVLDPLPIDDANSIFNKPVCLTHKPAQNVDIDDNGIVESSDYNLFLRELSVQSGD